tara:strand:- start:5438 stop:6481 length:1044 start_codon:yes stop_codon:yes gene_type:complete
LKILVLVRRYRKNQSEADEHDFNYTKKTLKEIEKSKKNIKIKFDTFKNYKEYIKWCPNYTIFLGFDSSIFKIKENFTSSKFCIWAKCYASSIDNKLSSIYEEFDYIFDSCFLNILNKKKNYFYLPTAIHKNYNYSFLKKTYLSFFNKKIDNQIENADLIFSGSPRFNRRDNYRQELISLLSKKNIKILICSSKKLWMKSNFKTNTSNENNIQFISSNYWATGRVYNNAKFVLDLPWLDTVIEKLEKNYDPQFALGWNVFRSGYNGANLITYKCDMNKDIGLNEQNCSFYSSNVENIANLADEIEYIIKNIDKAKIQYMKSNLKKHFVENHTYHKRWNFIIDKITYEK